MSEIKSNKISPRKGTTTTIGDSGDSVTISSGTTTTNAGTISTAGITGGTINNTTGSIEGLQQQVSWQTGSIKTTAFTASANEGYFCNTTSAAFTVTLPASPSAGDVIGLKDYANTFDTNNLTLNPNGNKIQGNTSNFVASDEGLAAILLYVDSTKGWLLVNQSKAADVQGPTFVTATGGTVTTCGNFKIHTFTGPGTFTVSQIGNPVGSQTVDYLVIAGGGGGGIESIPGGISGGGAGAGGYRESFPNPEFGGFPVSAQAYPITVGGGGSGGPSSSTNGSNSIFSTITSAGGGKGGAGGPIGNPGSPGSSGGSGGGGGSTNVNPAVGESGTGGSGNTPPVSPSQGNNGGNGFAFQGHSFGSGGGGGASAVGCNGGPANGGDGGDGTTSSINGTPTARAGGGGGAGRQPLGGTGTKGDGGSGGGGDGGNSATAANNGVANTGGGGGGNSSGSGVAGSGGSGVVIIRYKYQ